MRSLKNWASRTPPVEEEINDTQSLHLALLAYGVRKRYDYYEINVPYLIYVEGQGVIQHREGGRGTQVALLSNSHNSTLDAADIPDTIKVVMFGKKFNQPLDNLAMGIEFLIFPEDGEFNKPLDNLPVSVKALLLNRSYSLQLQLLPAGIKYIYIGNRMLHPIPLKHEEGADSQLRTVPAGRSVQPRLVLDTMS